MLKRVHIRLTAFFFCITLLILLSLSALCLVISENSLRQNSFSSFRSQMNTLLADLDSQTLFTQEWLSQVEHNGRYIIHITDNGTDFLWRSQYSSEKRLALVKEVQQFYVRSFSIQSADASGNPYAYHTEFTYTDSEADGNDYFACVAISHREGRQLSFLILMPLTQLNAQLIRQRLLFVIPVLCASIALLLFSWFYTGRLLKPIQESQAAQAAFVASASHELRTPLSVILSAADAIPKADFDQQPQFLSIIRQEGESMSRLITELLTLSGTDANELANVNAHSRKSGRLSFVYVKCEPDTLLLELFEAYEPLCKKSGHILQIELPDTKITPIQCDTDRIRQVFLILLHNACSYTPAGSIIRISLDCRPKAVTFLVSDNGPGIPDDEKKKIFQRFYRADAARRTDGHFGLGLSIAEKLMQTQGGALTVSDTPGGGATFCLTLPARPIRDS